MTTINAYAIRFDQRNSENTAYIEKYISGSNLTIITDSYGNVTASNLVQSSSYSETSSYALSASYAIYANTASSLIFSNNYKIGNLTASIIYADTYYGVLSGSLFGTSSHSIYSLTSSYIKTSETASYLENAILDGGNSSGNTLTIGSNDNNDLLLKTNSTTRMHIESSGEIVISGSLTLENIQTGSGETEVLTLDEYSRVKKRTFINVITKSAAFDLNASEEGYYIRYTGASDINCTILSSSVAPMHINSVFTVMQSGIGVVTVTGSSGTIVINGANKTGGQHKALQVVKVGTDTFDIIGGVT